MQSLTNPVKCSRCDIILTGREQFVGHMIHSHDFDYEQSEKAWSLIELLSNEEHSYGRARWDG